ncbi:hypothetical protein Tco_0109542 [Tanacetum coccineum]
MRIKTERELVRIKIADGNAFWNEIGVNAGITYYCWATVGSINIVRLSLVFLVQVNAVEAQEQVGEGLEIPTDSHHTPTTTQPSTSKPQKKQSRRRQRKDIEDPQLCGPTEPITDDTENVASVPTHSNDLLLNGEDRLKLNELIELCTKQSERVLALEITKTNQALEIDSLKRRVKTLEKKKGSRTHRIKRLFKVGRSAQVVSSKDKGLGDQEDASKQRRKIDEIDQDAEKEVDMAEKDVSTADPVTTADEVVNTTTTTVDELTLAQTLIEINAAKPKAVTTAVTRPKARGAKEKGKAKMVKPEKPLKKKDHIMFDKESKHICRHGYRVSETRIEGSSKRAGEELESENLKKQKLDENVEAEVDDDQEEAEMKQHVEIVPDDDVAIDAIPLATKPPIIVDWKIIKEGKMGYFQIIRVDGSSKRLEEGYERVLWGDLKVMFEPDVGSKV